MFEILQLHVVFVSQGTEKKANLQTQREWFSHI